MRDRGDLLEMVVGSIELKPGRTGLHLVVVRNEASRHDFEALRDIFQEMNVQAIIIPTELMVEVRHLGISSLRALQMSVNESLELLGFDDSSQPPGDASRIKGTVTPERVVNALERQPRLLYGVYQLLRERVGDFPMDDSG